MSDPSPGSRLGKYEVRAVLGRGAMGTVYDGMDPVIARRVAIKTVRLPDAGDAEAQEGLARFKREAQAAGRLNHPNIVGVFDYGETDELAYIVMEFVDGRTLRELLERDGRLPLSETLRVMDDVLAGLGYSHAHGVVHRDIKPANVILTAIDNRAKIADFGIARIESSTSTQAGTVLGTPAYMSPEQFMGQTVDRRTDIYSCGVLLYQLLTGERPFEGGLTAIMHKALNSTPPRPSELSVTAPPGLDAVVARAMARRPEDRFDNAAAFAEALRRGALATPDLVDATIVTTAARAGSAGVRPGSTIASEPPAHASGRMPLVVGGGTALVAAAAVAAWFLLAPANRAAPDPPAASVPGRVMVAAADPAAGPVALPDTPSVAAQPAVATATASAPVAGPQERAETPPQPPVGLAPPPPSIATLAPVEPPRVATAPASAEPPAARTKPGPPQGLAALPPLGPAAAPPPSATTLPSVEPPRATPALGSPAPPAPRARAAPLQGLAALPPLGPVTAPPPSATALPGVPPPLAAQAPPPLPASPPGSLASPLAEAQPSSKPLPPPANAPVPQAPVVVASADTPPPQPRASMPASAPPATVLPLGTPMVATPSTFAPAAPVKSAATIRAALAAALPAVPCTLANGDVADDGVATITGLSGMGQPEASLRHAVELAGPSAANWRVAGFDGSYCHALDVLRASANRAGSPVHRLAVALADGRRELHNNAVIPLAITMPDFGGHLEVDYVQHDGTVSPQVPSPAYPARTYTAGSQVAFGQPRADFPGWIAGPPFGTDMMVAIASTAPLFSKPRPDTEPLDAYLRELQAAMDDLRRRGGSLAVNAVVLDLLP